MNDAGHEITTWHRDASGADVMTLNVAGETSALPTPRRRPWPNPSGIMPTENKVLVLQDDVEEVTAGGVIKPKTVVTAEGFAQMEGRIIAQAIGAFNYLHDHEWQGEMPQPGDRIIIAKYAGVRVKGADGVEYVLVNDKDITAVRTA